MPVTWFIKRSMMCGATPSLARFVANVHPPLPNDTTGIYARMITGAKLVQWLLKRPAVLGVITFLAVFLGTIAYFYPRSPTENRLVVSEYVVCESEFEKDCGPHNAYVSCSVNTEERAAKACKRYGRKGDPDSHSVGKCGANLYRYMCINEQP